MVMAKLIFVVFVAALLGSCVSVPTSGDVRMNSSARHQVDLSGITVSFEMPSSPLRPSRDFGPILLLENVDLTKLTSTELFFEGHWDGPNYQWMKTMGTLRIWLDVRPWSPEQSGLQGCDAKAKAYIQSDFARSRRHFETGRWKTEPKLTLDDVRVAGQVAHRFSIDYDAPPKTTYIIPLNDRFFLKLIIGSSRNSDPEEGWDELASRAQQRFVDSLQLTGENLGCVM